MAVAKEVVAQADGILVKLRPSHGLRAAESRANLRPLYETEAAAAAMLGMGTEPQWFLAQLPDGAATPWDLAHVQVAEQLGVAPSDVVFAEPDLAQSVYQPIETVETQRRFAVGEKCEATGQDGKHGKARGPDVFAWHLGSEFSQLAKARDAVEFSDPRTRVAHFDTGYYRKHVTTPAHVLHPLEKNFVRGDSDDDSAEDPDNRLLVLDNSGHGTGTLSILAGGKFPAGGGDYVGGAPDAAVVPLRIADSVVLLRTSTFARALNYAVDQLCDVATMSMGGLPSRAWREAVDKAYLGGLCMVAAAGNNANGIPTRHIVYPARYGRVIAVCGVMADHAPYSGLEGITTLEGNYGPDSCMKTAMAAYTPNIPWARFGCENVVRHNGEGTSSATPQVAAAAALWFEKYKNELRRDWSRVEAVRNALFSSAKHKNADRKRLGRGVLQAFAALSVRPVLGLEQTKSDNDSFAFLRVLTGLGIAEPTRREQMFNLELTQRWLVRRELQEIVPDPDGIARLDDATLKKFMDAVIADEKVSLALRKHVAARYPVVAGRPAPVPAPRTRRPAAASKGVAAKVQPVCDVLPAALRDPPYRRLRVYAMDPSLSLRFDTASINEVTLQVKWETLEKGPVGEYLAVDNLDAAKTTFDAVDLDEPRLLARDGWAPSEGNAQFHQQMVYAVAMKTIEHFERALGRPVLWRPRPNPKNDQDDSGFCKQLAVRPHALRHANAYYSPQDVALLFGYFQVDADDPGQHMPGSRVYTCLSHDIIAHETTHAILDGMHRRFNEPTNTDVLALHEAFADVVALMQHFTIREVLESEIARTRGDIEAESMLGSLAIQFGRATGGRGALREAIGTMENGVWRRLAPDPTELARRQTPHSRGAVLVAAVFDAFITIYKARVADLIRIYTGGTGELPRGAIHPDLVRRLADEAAKSAGHVLTMCIRALDYLPPVDVTFFEYLRALITADSDLVTDDRHNYRVAFVEAFRRRGIYPVSLDVPSPDTLRTLSVDTLRWQGIDLSRFSKTARAAIETQYGAIVADLRRYADDCFYVNDRKNLFDTTREWRRKLHRRLRAAFKAAPQFAVELGLDPANTFEVHEMRRAMRVGPDGRHVPQVIVALTQSGRVQENRTDGTPRYVFRGGSTLVVDLSIPEVKYRIVKDIRSTRRRERTAAFVRDATADPLRALFFAPDRREPFAALHLLADGEG